MPLGVAPQTLQAVKRAAVAAEHVDNEVEVVEQDPFGSIDPFHQRGPFVQVPLERLAYAVRAVLDKKAEDVVVLDLRKAGGFTDFFIICTGGNPRQITAIADGVRETLKRDLGERPTLTEGIDRSEWILLDYFNFVVHVFSRDCRAFYGLERLWGNAERHEVSD